MREERYNVENACVNTPRYFLFTYITTVTVLSFPQLRAQYNISDMQVYWTVAIPALGLSIGPLFWSSLADVYGRRIIMVTGTMVALVATVGSAVAPNYAGYMTARLFQGFGVSPAATVGMAVINDLFFEYERGQKLGLWVMSMDMGLLVGPLGVLSLLEIPICPTSHPLVIRISGNVRVLTVRVAI